MVQLTEEKCFEVEGLGFVAVLGVLVLIVSSLHGVGRLAYFVLSC
jgi:hypothetical protein